VANDTTTLLYRFLGIDAGAGASFDRMAGKTALLGDSSKTALAKVKLLAAGTGLAGIGIGIAAVKMASDFQRSMLLIQTQAGASAGEVKQFSKALLSMSGQVAQSPEALATSLYHVYSTGLKGKQALDAVRIAAEGAKVGNSDLEETTNALTSSIASGIKGVQNYGQAMGALNAIVGAGDMHLSDLNDALGTGILTAAKVFNVSLTQVGAALAVFGDNNIRGQDAATKLRMAMQDIAQPAAHADKVLAQVGLTAGQLKAALAKGGLTSALEMLSSHMTAAGITAGKVGPFIEQAFTKKAGVGLGILIDQIQRYRQKVEEVQKGAAGFGSAWQATTQTAAFAFERLKSEAQAALITLGLHLLPVVTDMARWLGTNLPAAVHAIAPLVRAFAQDVGNVLGPAWMVVSGALRAVVVSLAAIGKAAVALRGPLTQLATVSLGVYGSIKLIGLGVGVFKAIQTAIILTRVRLLELREAFVAVAVGERAMSLGAFTGGMVTLGIAIYGVGKALSSVIDGNKQAFSTFRNLSQITASYRDQLLQTNGVLTDSIRLSVGKQLQDKGLADKAAAAGISLRQLEDAVTGSDSAMKRLVAQWEAAGKPSGDTIVTLAALHDGYGKAAKEASSLAGSTKTTTSAQKASIPVIKTAAQSIADLTKKLQNLVNAELSQAGTVDSFKEGLLGLKKQVKDNSDSLSQNTLKGLQNRDMLLGILQNAEKAAEGSKNYGKTLIGNVKQFEQFATSAGFSRGAVEKLLKQMHLMPKQIRTRISLDASGVSTALAALTQEAGAVGGRMAANMRASFRDGMGIKSPSRVMQYYGQQMIAGLKNGLKGASAIAKALAHGFISGWKDGTSKLKTALSTPVQTAMDRLTTVVDNAIKKQQDRLKTARTALKDLLKQRTSDIASLAGNISGSAGLSNLFGTDANGNPTVTNANTFLSAQAKTLQNFAADLKWGSRHGLSPALLSQIADLGADQGDQVLKQFMSGQASIGRANASEAAIQRYSTGAATTVESAVYAKSVARDRKVVEENSRELRQLTHALHRIEQRTAREASMHLTIDAKTGKPTVDKHFIEDIIKGIRAAQRVAGKKLL